MKKLILLLLLCSSYWVTFAQNEDNSIQEYFLLEEFKDGEAYFKLGGNTQGKFNYGLFAEKILII